MTFDRLENLSFYLPINLVSEIQSSLKRIDTYNCDQIIPILEERVYLKVMEYETLPKEDCLIEAHDKYVDIQSALDGSEGIDLFDRRCLQTSKTYDENQDVEFFDNTGAAAIHNVTVIKGYFAMIFPHEAHRPKQEVCGNRKVKKFVIKILQSELITK